MLEEIEIICAVCGSPLYVRETDFGEIAILPCPSCIENTPEKAIRHAFLPSLVDEVKRRTDMMK